MLFKDYSPQCLRDVIEYELKSTDDAKTAAIMAIKNLNKDPGHYMQFGVMTKAKYISRTGSPGKYKYVYAEDKKVEKKEKPANQTETKEFKEWFGDSKVVDKSGKPLVVYHGTDKDFKQFDKEKIGNKFEYSIGFHFADDLNEAKEYLDKKNKIIKSVFLNVQNPLIIKTEDKGASHYIDMNRGDIAGQVLESRKTDTPYDGVIVEGSDGSKNYVVFKPNQIKSATGNKGTFDPNSADMTKANLSKTLNPKTAKFEYRKIK